MRRLPYAVRSSHAVLQQIHESLEEAASNLGASRIKTLMSITIPLIMPGLVAGAVLTFVSCFTEVSTSLMLQPIIGPYGLYARPLALQILLESKGGPTAVRVASCLGVIQIIASTVSIYVSFNKRVSCPMILASMIRPSSTMPRIVNYIVFNNSVLNTVVAFPRIHNYT